MPTQKPRIQTSWDKETYGVILELSKLGHKDKSEVISDLVHQALEDSDDLALATFAEERLRTFDRSKALTMDEVEARFLGKGKHGNSLAHRRRG